MSLYIYGRGCVVLNPCHTWLADNALETPWERGTNANKHRGNTKRAR